MDSYRNASASFLKCALAAMLNAGSAFNYKSFTEPPEMNKTDDKSYPLVSYSNNGNEGYMPVPGGVLHYRCSGNKSSNDVVVFENGWGTLFPYAAWLEQAMSPYVRVICYDRAGIGNSTSTEPITTARITEQFMALIQGLGVSQQVVVVGHSYGGLIAALHAAQAQGRIRAVIQVDPTPEFSYEGEASVDSAPTTTFFSKLAIRLGYTGFITSMYDGLPEDARSRLVMSRAWMIHILNGSIPEIRLFREIRRVVQESDTGNSCPRLVISGIPPARKGLIKLVVSQAKLDAIIKTVHDVHQRQARVNSSSRWTKIPYDHFTMLSNRAGAEHVAKCALEFLQSIAAAGVSTRI